MFIYKRKGEGKPKVSLRGGRVGTLGSYLRYAEEDEGVRYGIGGNGNK